MIKRIALAYRRWKASRRWVAVGCNEFFIFEQRMDGKRRLICGIHYIYPNSVNRFSSSQCDKWLHGGDLPSYAIPIEYSKDEI